MELSSGECHWTGKGSDKTWLKLSWYKQDVCRWLYAQNTSTCHAVISPWEMKFLRGNFQAYVSDCWLRYLLWNCTQTNVTKLYWWYINSGSGNGLVPSSIWGVIGFWYFPFWPVYLCIIRCSACFVYIRAVISSAFTLMYSAFICIVCFVRKWQNKTINRTMITWCGHVGLQFLLSSISEPHKGGCS